MLRSLAGALFVGSVILSLIACTVGETAQSDRGSGSSDTEDSGGEIEVRYATFMVGSHVSAEAEKQVIEEFNEKYRGKIRVNIEELPSDSAYAEKMKTLAASNDLPDVVIGKEGIRELAVRNGQAVDLMPYLEEDQEWKRYVGDGAIEYNRDGDFLYSVANAKHIIGYFYNIDMFNEAKIKPALTWEEFMDNNEKLLLAGYTPMALMTGENCWTTNLWLSAMIGTDGEEGNAFMNGIHPESYENASVIKALSLIQTCLKYYTTNDAIGALYANAASNFLQGQAAMIANGTWMTLDFTNPEKAIYGLNVGVAPYPEGGLVEQYEVGYTLCTNGKGEKIQKAALEFLKFKTGKRGQEIFLEKSSVLPLTDRVILSEEYKKRNPLVAELVEMSNTNTYDFYNIDNTAIPTTIEAFSSYYPDLAAGDLSAGDMAEILTESAEMSQ